MILTGRVGRKTQGILLPVVLSWISVLYRFSAAFCCCCCSLELSLSYFGQYVCSCLFIVLYFVVVGRPIGTSNWPSCWCHFPHKFFLKWCTATPLLIHCFPVSLHHHEPSSSYEVGLGTVRRENDEGSWINFLNRATFVLWSAVTLHLLTCIFWG